ncbi:MAG: SpoIIE family protein phosphatase [Streptosporangiaceae bacterium]
MQPPAELSASGLLDADSVLSQAETGVIAVDRSGNLTYANPFAVALFGLPDDAPFPAGRPLSSLGFEEGAPYRTQHLLDQVLRGREWEGTLASQRSDGVRVFVRAHAAPLRRAGGEISGVVLVAQGAASLGAQRSGGRIGLLERVGERLASSLELSVTLREVAETLVPQFADHCFIDLFHGNKLVRRAQLHARGWTPAPGTWAVTGEQVRLPPGSICQLAMDRMEPVVVADVSEDLLVVPTPAALPVREGIGLTSAVAAPLIARGQLLGVMSLFLSRLSRRPNPRYSADDRDFVGAIAGRVAVAIDNAMLFEEERRTALAFQTSLLPHDPPPLDGLEVAYSYVPAKPLETHGQGIQTQVGGDWYDIILLSAGRVGIVIGDVEGRGAKAAAVMGQLRAALRAFAQDDKSPAEILRRLDDWCRSLGPSRAEGPDSADSPTVSCLYLIYDAWSRVLSFANAGHAPPMLVTAAGVTQLDIQHQGVLLGARGKGMAGLPSYREESRQLEPGSMLVFYTDGLTDRRQRADGTGPYSDAEVTELLQQAVTGAAQASVAEVARAVERAVPGDIDDDMAVVVVRTSTADLASWEGRFGSEPIMVSQARRMALETFLSWGMQLGQAELACLLVSEVVTNVVLHAAPTPSPRPEFALAGEGSGWPAVSDDWDDSPFADGLDGAGGGEFTLRLRRGHDAVWVEVFDADLRLPRIRSAGETDEGGRGLYLVDQLATRWGSRPTKDGKAVWFELPMRG